MSPQAVEAPLEQHFDATIMIDVRQGLSFRVGTGADVGRRRSIVLRIDTPIEAAYFRAGGILPYVLEQVVREETSP